MAVRSVYVSGKYTVINLILLKILIFTNARITVKQAVDQTYVKHTSADPSHVTSQSNCLMIVCMPIGNISAEDNIDY